MDRLTKTTIDLLRFKTTKDRPKEIKDCLTYIRRFYRGTSIKIREFKHNGISTLYLSFDGKKRHTLVLNGHIDVAPEQDLSQYTPQLQGNKLYGRGAADMKGAVAVMMHLLRDLANERPEIALMLTTDEETGGFDGAMQLLNAGYRPGFFLTGEPSGLAIGNRAKGILVLELTVTGKSAHAATPWLGKSAILKMQQLIPALEKLFPKNSNYFTTINLSVIRGGDAWNKSADSCSLIVDIRHIPEDDPKEIIRRIKTLGFKVKILERGSYAYCKQDEPNLILLERALRKNKIKPVYIAKNAASDARHFTKKGIPATVFGPDGKNIHGRKEYVDIRSLKSFYNVLKELVAECENLSL